MGAKWIGKWAGGRIREVRGKRVYVIERMRRVISLNVDNEAEANAELALFLRSPETYQTRAEQSADATAAVLDDVLLTAFLAEAARRELNEQYRRYILRHYLIQWGEALGGRDLRRVPLREYHRLLDGWTAGRKQRIIAIKAFTAWLRETGRLRPADDATMELRVPPSRAAKSVKAKGYTMQQVERVYAQIGTQYVRDLICLRAKAGMHHTEIERIGERNCELRRIDDPSGITGTVKFPHKSSRIHIVSLDAQAFAAADRLNARGSAPCKHTVQDALRWAASRLGPNETPLLPGELRHSFATWATMHGTLVKAHAAGVPLDQVAMIMGHVTPRTTKIFYEGNQVPAMISLPLRLFHPEDPVQLPAVRSVG